MIHKEARILIRAEGLCKYCSLGNDTVEAVGDLDISVRQGEFVMLRGISGIRKNALFNLLGCLERPDAGKYYFDYEDIALSKDSMLEDIRRSRIGYLFRDFRLIDRFTAYQNIEVPTYGLNIADMEKAERIERALREIGIDKIAGKQVSGISDFDRQLVGLARAIVNEPLMLMADEPSANLSIDEAGRLMEHLQRLNEKGTTILLFTSRDDIVLTGSCRVIVFDDGRLSSDGQENLPAFNNGGSI